MATYTVTSASATGLGAWTPTDATSLPASSSFTLVSVSNTYAILTSDFLVKCDSSSVAFTVTLPTAVGVAGKIYIIKSIGSKIVTVATTSAQTIDDVTTYKIKTQYSSVQVMSDGANWIII